jgi:hypothetical protein
VVVEIFVVLANWILFLLGPGPGCGLMVDIYMYNLGQNSGRKESVILFFITCFLLNYLFKKNSDKLILS